MAAPTLLGTVEDVAGATIRVQLAEGTVSGLSFIEGQAYRVGQVGGGVSDFLCNLTDHQQPVSG